MNNVVDHARHTPYSDPGAHADLVTTGLARDDRVDAVPADPTGLSAVARNVIVHYRASGHELPTGNRGDIDARWLEAILTIDQSRHRAPLDEHRDPVQRVQGCCRDHTLFCLGVLRSNEVPARSRVGFAGYFVDGWHHDHVVVEAWLDGRWRRFDAEVDAPRPVLATPTDIGHCEVDGRGFVTAAQVWSAWRTGDVDAATYGVDPEVPILRGPRFLFDEVIHEVAHRFGDELLLWDTWGRMGGPDEPLGDGDPDWLDPIAALLLASDHGDLDAERSLLDRYRTDAGLHPGPTVVQASPFGDPPVEVRLTEPPERDSNEPRSEANAVGRT